MTTLAPLNTKYKKRNRVMSHMNVAQYMHSPSSSNSKGERMTRSDIKSTKSCFKTKSRRSSKRVIFRFGSHDDVDTEAMSNLQKRMSKNKLINNTLKDKINYFYKPYDKQGAVGVPLTMRFDELNCRDIPDSQLEQLYDQHAKQNWKRLHSNILLNDNEIFRKFLNGVNSSLYSDLKSVGDMCCIGKHENRRRTKSTFCRPNTEMGNIYNQGLDMLKEVVQPKRDTLGVNLLTHSSEPRQTNEVETNSSSSKKSYNDALITPLIMLARANKLLSSPIPTIKESKKDNWTNAETVSTRGVPKRKASYQTTRPFLPISGNVVPGSIEKTYDNVVNSKSFYSTKNVAKPRSMKFSKKMVERLQSNSSVTKTACSSCKTVSELNLKLIKLRKQNAENLRKYRSQMENEHKKKSTLRSDKPGCSVCSSHKKTFSMPHFGSLTSLPSVSQDSENN